MCGATGNRTREPLIVKLQKSSCQGRVFLPRVYLCGATRSRTRDPLTVKFKSLAAKVKSSCQGFTLAGRTFSQGDEGSNLLLTKVPRVLVPRSLAGSPGTKSGTKVPGRFPWYQECRPRRARENHLHAANYAVRRRVHAVLLVRATVK